MLVRVGAAEALPAAGEVTLTVVAADEARDSVALPVPEVVAGDLRVEPGRLRLPPGAEAPAELVVTGLGNAAGEAQLVLDEFRHLSLAGAPDRIALVPGEEQRFEVTVQLGEGAAPGLPYAVGLKLVDGERHVGQAFVQVSAVGQDAHAVLGAVEVAEALGRGDLVATLIGVAEDLERLALRCTDVHLEKLRRNLRALVGDLSDEVFAEPRGALRAIADQLEARDCAEWDVQAVNAAIADLRAILEALRDHDFKVHLTPVTALARPGEEIPFALRVERRGALPTTIELRL